MTRTFNPVHLTAAAIVVAAGLSLQAPVALANENLMQEAIEAEEDFRGDMTELLEDIRERAEELDRDPDIDREDAREVAEKSLEGLVDLVKLIESGGEVDVAFRAATTWMEQQLQHAKADTKMSEADRREVVHAWEDEIARMRGHHDALRVEVTRLNARISDLDGALVYLTNVELLRVAKLMNKAAERIVFSLREAVHQLSPPATPSS